MTLYWTLLSGGRIQLGMQANIGTAQRWIAIAFPVSVGVMNGARALAVRPGTADVVAATLSKSGGVVQDSSIAIESKQSWHASSVLSTVLTVSGFPGIGVQNILYAWGAFSGSTFLYHTSRHSINIAFGIHLITTATAKQ